MKSLHSINTAQYSEKVRSILWAHTEKGRLGKVFIENDNVYYSDFTFGGPICISFGEGHVDEWREKGKPRWNKNFVEIVPR